jgi:hypothetical protein
MEDLGDQVRELAGQLPRLAADEVLVGQAPRAMASPSRVRMPVNAARNWAKGRALHRTRICHSPNTATSSPTPRRPG